MKLDTMKECIRLMFTVLAEDSSGFQSQTGANNSTSCSLRTYDRRWKFLKEMRHFVGLMSMNTLTDLVVNLSKSRLFKGDFHDGSSSCIDGS